MALTKRIREVHQVVKEARAAKPKDPADCHRLRETKMSDRGRKYCGPCAKAKLKEGL